MPSSYTTSLRLTLPATGELTGTWGTTVNTGITELLDSAVAGTTTISTWGGAGVPYTLSNTDGAADEARKMFIVATGAPGEAKNVICPAVSKLYFFRNDTTGGFALTLKTSGGSGIAVPAGQYKVLYCNGTNVVEAFNSLASLTLGTALAASSGGTGQSTYTTGDLIYASGASALSKLGIGTNGQILTSTGTAPQWSTLSGVAVTTFSAGTTGFTPSTATSGAVTLAGTLATTNGGTGLTSFTSGGVVYASSSSALATGSALTFDGTNFTTTGYAAGNGLRSLGGNAVRFYNAANANWSQISAPAGTGDMQFDTGAGEQMRLTSTGLGIGTSSPGYKLDVSASVTNQAIARLNNSDTNDGNGLYIKAGGVNAGKYALYVEDGSGTALLNLLASGNLGIGTSSPAYKLVVSNAGAQGFEFDPATGIFQVYNRGTSAYGSMSQYASQIRFLTGSSPVETMRLDSSGNLGIGTSSPAGKVDSVSNAYAAFVARSSTSGAGQTVDALKATDSAAANFANAVYSATSHIWNYTGATEGMRLDSSGNLGIGTSSPVSALGFGEAASATGVTFQSTNTTFNSGKVAAIKASVLGSGNGSMVFETYAGGSGGGEQMRLDSSGNLGIGTSSPVSKLQVNNGYIVAGTAASTNGSKILGGQYTTGNLATFGGEYSNGGPVIGYGVWPSTSAAGAFVSSTTINVARGAYTIVGNQHLWYSGDAQTVAIDGAVTTSEQMRLDSSGNLGLGVTPSAWISAYRAIDLGVTGSVYGRTDSSIEVSLVANGYRNSSGNWIYRQTAIAGQFGYDTAGTWYWKTAPSGTAGTAISFTQAMTLDSSGNLGIGTSSPGYRLSVNGDAAVLGQNTLRLQNSDNTNAYALQNAGATGSGNAYLSFVQSGVAERMRLDSSGNLGLGITPSAWGASQKAVEVGTFAALADDTTGNGLAGVMANLVLNGTTYRYKLPAPAFGGAYLFSPGLGSHRWFTTDAAGTGPATASLTTAMTLDASGNLQIGRTTSSGSPYKLELNSTADTRFALSVGTTLTGGIDAAANLMTLVAYGVSTPMTFQVNGSERMRLDTSGNLGLGVTPSAWDTATFRTLQVGSGVGSVSLSGRTDNGKDLVLGSNIYYATGSFRYVGTDVATMYRQDGAAHQWFTAPSGTAGNAISFTQAMTLDASGNLTVGTTSPGGKLTVYNNASSYALNTRFYNESTNTGGYCVALFGQAASGSASGIIGTGGSTAGNPAFQNTFVVGTQGSHALVLATNDTERARITSTGNVVAGGSVALATTATDGFLYVPTCAGTPTGTPTAITGMAPIVVDTTNNKMYFYSGGAWRDAGP